MKITAVSDLHGFLPELLGGDVLVVAGDCTGNGSAKQWVDFFEWLKNAPYKNKILVAGNHDEFLFKFPVDVDKSIHYLCDSSLTIDGIKFYGSPWTPMFCNWFFMLPRHSKELRSKWDAIPLDTDVLITHGPPYKVLDKCYRLTESKKLHHVGDEILREVLDSGRLSKLRLHIFGHIHMSYGQCYRKYAGHPRNIKCCNVAIMNEMYIPQNKPTEIEI